MQTREKEVSKFIIHAPDEFQRFPIDKSRFRTDNDFIEYNLNQYHQCKTDNSKLAYENEKDGKNVHGYFVIGIDWMERWRHYLRKSGDPNPGEVDNLNLQQKVYKLREKLGFPDYDDDLGLKDKRDYYILSKGFF